MCWNRFYGERESCSEGESFFRARPEQKTFLRPTRCPRRRHPDRSDSFMERYVRTDGAKVLGAQVAWEAAFASVAYFAFSSPPYGATVDFFWFLGVGNTGLLVSGLD